MELAVASYLERELEYADQFLVQLTIAKNDKLMRLDGMVLIPIDEDQDVIVQNIVFNSTRLQDKDAKKLLISAAEAGDTVYDMSEFIAKYAQDFDPTTL